VLGGCNEFGQYGTYLRHLIAVSIYALPSAKTLHPVLGTFHAPLAPVYAVAVLATSISCCTRFRFACVEFLRPCLSDTSSTLAIFGGKLVIGAVRDRGGAPILAQLGGAPNSQTGGGVPILAQLGGAPSSQTGSGVPILAQLGGAPGSQTGSGVPHLSHERELAGHATVARCVRELQHGGQCGSTMVGGWCGSCNDRAHFVDVHRALVVGAAHEQLSVEQKRVHDLQVLKRLHCHRTLS
jgi:hypothetical protein